MQTNGLRTAAVWIALSWAVLSQAADTYDSLVSRAMQALNAKEYAAAITTAEKAIALDPGRFDAYVYAAKGYDAQHLFDDEIGMLQLALPRAPEEKKQLIRDALADCRRQIAAQSAPRGGPAGPPPAAASQAATTQAEVVLWKAIENSTRPEDYQGYLAKYPEGTFAPVAQARLDAMKNKEVQAQKAKESDLALSGWQGSLSWSTGKGAKAQDHQLNVTLKFKDGQNCEEIVAFSDRISDTSCTWKRVGDALYITGSTQECIVKVPASLTGDLKIKYTPQYVLTVRGAIIEGIRKEACLTRVGIDQKVTFTRSE